MSRHFLACPDELIAPKEAERLSRRSAQTVRIWGGRYGLGVNVAGRWLINRIALRLFLSGETEALALFRAGDRTDARVIDAYEAEQLSPPRSAEAARSARHNTLHGAVR